MQTWSRSVRDQVCTPLRDQVCRHLHKNVARIGIFFVSSPSPYLGAKKEREKEGESSMLSNVDYATKGAENNHALLTQCW
jgi:hypothetical protein